MGCHSGGGVEKRKSEVKGFQPVIPSQAKSEFLDRHTNP